MKKFVLDSNDKITDGGCLIISKKEAVDLLNLRREENEVLKKDIKILEQDFEELLKQKCGYIRAIRRYEDDIARLEKGLPRLTRDEYDKMWPISSKWDEVEAEFIARKLSNDKQPTPAEKMDDTQSESPSSESIDFNFKVLFDRLGRVERAITKQLRIEL